MRISRRRLLQAAGSALLLPLRHALAQQAGALLRAPRRALVIGNSAYRVAPLKNPANDARAVSEVLKRTGFEVSHATDLPRAAMEQAIRAYAEEVRRSRAIGLFYFAGHGVQLAWRNYLLPVDAAAGRMEDIQRTCVDLNTVIEGIAKAANPMNLIVLDACRDNPFGADFRVEQKGLSQLDAPPGTLLAYATSPGNVASDGAGANGLYTEHLVREMAVPEAKIEDVFKRVRLGVRRGSSGRQVPWESTSLEDDFWFIPPKELKKLSDEEAEREYRQELARWEKIADSLQAAPFEEYLMSSPSGRFAELAQAQLDRVLEQQGEKKVAPVAAPENPYSKGSASANTSYKPGDRYTYQRMDLYSRFVTGRFQNTVTKVSGTQVFYDRGLVTDLLGNFLRTPDGRVWTANQTVPAEFAVGKRWRSRHSVRNKHGGEFQTEMDMRIVTRERITVPVGTFDAFRIEGDGRSWSTQGSSRVQTKLWFAPERLRRPLARDFLQEGRRIIAAERIELVDYKESQAPVRPG